MVTTLPNLFVSIVLSSVALFLYRSLWGMTEIMDGVGAVGQDCSGRLRLGSPGPADVYVFNWDNQKNLVAFTDQGLQGQHIGNCHLFG